MKIKPATGTMAFAGILLFMPLLAPHAMPAAQAGQIGDVFYIPLENKDLSQIKGNAAAPYINSLLTPGNANAANVSYATNYTNAGVGVHNSEPNYIWSEAGTNYNAALNTVVVNNDSDPTVAHGNVFNPTDTPHLTGLLNAASIPWKNYEEDYQYSTSVLVSKGGTLPAGVTNPYNGSNQIGYAVKHNPMAFFTDTDTENVEAISQLTTDLNNNTVGRYNWITPDLYNDMHTNLPSGFTYHGTNYTGGQAEIAQGDNFLSIIIPQIEASDAFKNNGLIVIWNDESEGGDTTTNTIPEIIISPLAKGNAYASSVALNHSSDIKTMQEIFGLGPTFLNNEIPGDGNSLTPNEYSVSGGPGTYNTVAGSNDLSDLFQPGVIPSSVPEPATITLLGLGGLLLIQRRKRVSV